MLEYDAVGRRTASIDANENRTEYEYDAVMNNTLVRDASGNVTRYEYDAANRRWIWRSWISWSWLRNCIINKE